MPSEQPPPRSSWSGCLVALLALVALVGLGSLVYGRRPPETLDAGGLTIEPSGAVFSEPERAVERPAEAPAEEGCEPPCEPGSFCHDRVCRPFAAVSCGALSACDGPEGRQCFDAQSACDTGFLMTPCQSPGRRECRDGVVVCIPRGRNAGGCSPPSGGVCDPSAQCRCPTDRPSSCADWWAQPGMRRCVDMQSDDAHCGGCDVVCDNDGAARSTCREGRCVCPAGLVACPEPAARWTLMRCRAQCPGATSDGGVSDAGGDAGADARATEDATDAARADSGSDAGVASEAGVTDASGGGDAGMISTPAG